MKGKYGLTLILLVIPVVAFIKRYQANKGSINSIGMFAIVLAASVIFAIIIFINWWGWYKDPLRNCPICKKPLNGEYEIYRTSPRDAKVTCKKCGNTYNIRR